MSNGIEMKRLADVESVETVSDEASVLIVQDGEVKQTAKSNVGGGLPEGGASVFRIGFTVESQIHSGTDLVCNEVVCDKTAEEFSTAFQTGANMSAVLTTQDGDAYLLSFVCIAADGMMQFSAVIAGLEFPEGEDTPTGYGSPLRMVVAGVVPSKPEIAFARIITLKRDVQELD